jgi:RNA polymerase sigma-70 factor (ECF subfamily)
MQSPDARRRLHKRGPNPADIEMTDQSAFLDATLPHLDALWNVARRMAPDPASAEDLVQETWLRAFRSYHTQGSGDLRSWLVAICMNTARSEFRRHRRRPQEQSGASIPATPSDVDVAATALAAVQREALTQTLAELPEAQRVAIVLVDLAGLTAQEAADVLGAPRGTILARVHRGRRQLACLLEGEGIRDGP